MYLLERWYSVSSKKIVEGIPGFCEYIHSDVFSWGWEFVELDFGTFLAVGKNEWGCESDFVEIIIISLRIEPFWVRFLIL